MYILTPKFWYGSELWALLRVFPRRGFSVAPARIPALVVGLYFSFCNSVLGAACYLVFAHRLSRVEFRKPPIFIIGHWRSGTTYLHELLASPPDHAAPNGYQCFLPGHFLLTERLFRPVLRLFLSRNRPMDAMELDLERPQEDEFAIFNRTGLSNYRAFVAPGSSLFDRTYLGLHDASADERETWQHCWIHFLKSVQLTAGESRRLILKSPQHTARIGLLLKLFPDAKFIHIARDPASIYLSTLKTWCAMIDEHALVPSDRFESSLPESVLGNFENLYERYDDDVGQLGEKQLCELRYEDLVSDPLAALKQIFATLDLAGFEKMRPHFERRVAESRNYKAGTATSDPELRLMVEGRLSRYVTRFGYGEAEGQPAPLKAQDLGSLQSSP